MPQTSPLRPDPSPPHTHGDVRDSGMQGTGDDGSKSNDYEYDYGEFEDDDDDSANMYAEPIIQDIVGGHTRDVHASESKNGSDSDSGGTIDSDYDSSDGFSGDDANKDNNNNDNNNTRANNDDNDNSNNDNSDAGVTAADAPMAAKNDGDDDHVGEEEEEDVDLSAVQRQKRQQQQRQHRRSSSSGAVVVGLLEMEHKMRKQQQQQRKLEMDNARQQQQDTDTAPDAMSPDEHSMTESEVLEYEELLQTDAHWLTSRSAQTDRKSFRHISVASSTNPAAVAASSLASSSSSPPLPAEAISSSDGTAAMARSVSSTSLSSAQVDGEDRNAYFRQLFHLPESEQVLEDFHCAYYKRNKILTQGRMYLSQNHVAFYSSIFSKKVSLVIPFRDIVSIDKKTTVLIVPNAIEIVSRSSVLVEPADQSRDSIIASSSRGNDIHFFGSFMFRDQAYNILREIWKLHQYKIRKQQRLLRHQQQQKHRQRGDRSSGDSVVHRRSAVGEDDTDNDLDDEDDIYESGSEDDIDDDEEEEEEERGGIEDVVDWCVDEDNITDPSELSTADPFFPIDKCKPRDVVPGEVINLPLRTLCNLWMADHSTMERDYHDKRGDTEFQITKWRKDESGVGMLREANFISPVKHKIGPKQTRVVVHQRMVLFKGRKRLINEQSMRSLDVPYGDSFRILGSIELTERDSNSTAMRLRIGVHFVKSTMLRWQIESAVFKEASESYTFYFNMAKQRALDYIQEQEQRKQQRRDGAKTRRKGVPKKRGKRRALSQKGHRKAAAADAASTAEQVQKDVQQVLAPPAAGVGTTDASYDDGWMTGVMEMASGVLEMLQPYTTMLLFGFLAILMLFVLIPQQMSISSSVARLEESVQRFERSALSSEQEMNLLLWNMTSNGKGGREYADMLKQALKSAPESEGSSRERLVLQSVLLELRALQQKQQPQASSLSNGSGDGSGPVVSVMYHLHVLTFAVLLLVGSMLYRVLLAPTPA